MKLLRYAQPARPASVRVRDRRIMAKAIVSVAFLSLLFVLLNDHASAGSGDFSRAQSDQKFTHSSHSQIKCDACHVRRADAIKPTVPGHRACVSCHVKEFTTTSFGICSNCHEGITAVRPPVQAFPERQSFGLEFSHKSHATYVGGERRADCSECHSINGAVGTFPGHKECYVCHKAPDQVKAGEKAPSGSCGECHTTSGSRAKLAAGGKTYRLIKFSHSEHAAGGVRCAECHGVVGDGEGVQVSQPALREHIGTSFGRSCGSCHNGRRAFSGDSSCSRCHRDKV
jgi:c(7)-type cytochrome triheme protein